MGMESATSSDEVWVCPMCGDEGFTNALVFCVKCLDYPIHRYCLDVMPRTFDELVIWVCEHCKPTVSNQVTFAKSSQSQKEEAANFSHRTSSHPKKKQKKEREITSLIAGTEEVNCHKNTTEPDGLLAAWGAKKKNSRLLNSLRKGTQRSCTTMVDPIEHSCSDSSPTSANLNNKKGIDDPQLSQPPCETDKRPGLIEHEELISDSSLMKKESDKTSNRECEAETDRMHTKDDISTNKHGRDVSQSGDFENNEQDDHCQYAKPVIDQAWSSPTATNLKNKIGIDDPQLSQPPLDLIEHEKLISDSSFMKKESDKTSNHECKAETDRMQTKDDISASEPGRDVSQPGIFENNEQDDHYQYAQPVIDQAWRGSFNVLHKDYDIFEGFVAHLSNKACHKVIEEASKLPSLLSVEMHPKTVLWPKSFHEHEPSDDHIALYFFPENPINERAFDHLVADMMHEGLALRATTKNAELLIFTSTVLPQLFWRFKGYFYLWGVFRSKRNNSTPPLNHDLTVSNNLTRVKTLDARSPQSPLSNNGENGDPESGD